MLDQRYNYDLYRIRRKVLRIVGASFHICNPDGELQFFVDQKGFKLKEDIKIFTGEDKNQEVLSIQARNVIDFSAIYDIYDSETHEKIGALRRKGLKSVLKDEWLILDSNDAEVGNIKEDGMALALVRRILTNLVPQTFIGTLQEEKIFEFRQKFNPFIHKMDLDFSFDKDKKFDRRLAIAASVLLSAIEGRQG